MPTDLAVRESVIAGLFVIDLVVHSDPRGNFKENYQQQKLEALGLPHFNIVQNNISYNKDVGVIRGLHTEPWEKFISVAQGEVFCAWVDLRKGPGFGQKLTLKITADKAVFVPRGVANGYQTLTENTVYTYLVNDFWSADKKYQSVNVYDEQLAIAWPISKEQAIISDKDAANPMMSEIQPLEY